MAAATGWAVMSQRRWAQMWSAAKTSLPYQWSKWKCVLTSCRGAVVVSRTAEASRVAWAGLESVSITSAAVSPTTTVALTSSTGSRQT
nr:hypothetical protein [Fodinicola feengrottensis]